MASITQYVKEHYFNEIAEAGKEYFLKHAHILGVAMGVASEVVTVEYSKIEYVTAGNRNDELIDIDVLLNVYAEVTQQIEMESSSTQKRNRWLRVSCTALVDDGLQNFQVKRVTPYKKGQISIFDKPLSDELVPFLWKEELDETAEEILSLYYPEIIQEPMAIDPHKFAKILGLSIEYRPINEGGNEETYVFGRIYFEEDSQKGIPKRTIVIDSNLEDIRPKGTVNNTIIHECLHWILHRYSVELDKGSKDIVANIATKEESTTTDWMEWQVHSLAPRIMMPKRVVRQFVESKFRELVSLDNTIEVIDIIETLIDETAKFFGVTIVAAQKRLVEIGLEEARGARNFIDGHYVPVHTWRKGFLGVEQTFSIGVYELTQLLTKHESLRNRLTKGGLVYVDSHLCLNDEKYIIESEDGKLIMTRYARTHMDECCLVFERKSNVSHKSNKISFVPILNNSADLSVTSQISYPSSADNLKIEEESSLLLSYGKDILNVLKNLPQDFGGALKNIREWRKMSVETLAFESLISVRTIYSLQKNEKDPQLRTVVALSIAMTLPYRLAKKFLEISGRILRENDEEMMYDTFLTTTGAYTVEHCNNILEACHFQRLTPKKSL